MPVARRDAYREAVAATGGRYDPRLLEPWGPEAAGDPFLAPDPVAHGIRGSLPVVSPLGSGDITWDGLCAHDPALAAWCRPRWLAALRPLPPIPDSLHTTVARLHLLAEHVVAPWRFAAHGRIGLRWTLGGFGTPWAHVDEQVRVVGDVLVHQQGAAVREHQLTTLGEVAEWLGGPLGAPREVYTAAQPAEASAPVAVDPAASAWLGEWFGFATRALEEVRAGEADYDRRRVQLWPEHFDVAVDLGDGAARATFGASPGDAAHDGPYLYVKELTAGRLGDAPDRDPAFAGVSLPVSALLGVEDPLDAAVSWFARHRVEIQGG